MALWFRYCFQAVASTVAVLPRGRNLLRTRHPRFHALRGVLLLLTSLFAFFSVQAHAGGRVHGHRDDHAAGGHAAGHHLAGRAGFAAALGAGGGRLRRHARHHPPATRRLQLGHAAAAGPGGLQRVVPGAHQQARPHRRPDDHALLHRLDRHAAGVAGAAVRLDGAARLGAVGRVAAHGTDGDRGAFFADPGLRAGARVHPHAVPLRPDRLCHAGRLGGVFARARRLVDGGHRADRHLRRRGRLAHRARKSCSRTTPPTSAQR